MTSKEISEAVKLYHRDSKVVVNGDSIGLQRLTYEECEENKKSVLYMLKQVSKDDLINYIINNT